ncbi:DUF6415 family natural product biosynthesis protein [Streptomyces sp. NPDC000658]|uniref:DUF6415 family natural product biosynthesis protein n=1 Tax=Streptomyces sp. NPDC000658 TaxID=3154266 RepID=UPI00331653DD
MSAPAVAQWAPANEETLTTLLAAVRQWRPFDGDALLDDVGAALDDVMPGEDDVEDIAERLRGHLMQLVDIALAGEANDDEEAALLIERARQVRVEDVPGEHWRAVGHLRRMAWIVNELLERLGALRCLKECA